MLLLMLERDMPIDAVITADTGMEFPEMYEHLDRLDEHLFHERGIHMTVLRHPKGFEWLMFEEPTVLERLQGTGVVPREVAEKIGLVGVARRASAPTTLPVKKPYLRAWKRPARPSTVKATM